MGCIYCEEGIPLMDNVALYELYAELNISGNILNLNIDVADRNDYEYELQIHFCPMCGEKL